MSPTVDGERQHADVAAKNTTEVSVDKKSLEEMDRGLADYMEVQEEVELTDIVSGIYSSCVLGA